ncbi:MAG TPA: FkbM family methyltransferase [Rhizomicrobium sp.]|nr:FkbM family methyltransferase [Rhizomicrobium sp.]
MIERLKKVLSARGVDFGTFRTVFDIGSRDGQQSLELSELFGEADIVAIECNPGTLDQCRKNVAQNPRITLVEKAINSYTGNCPFFPIDPKRTITTWKDGNPGASSLFLATGDYPAEKYVQNEIEVECTRLDDLCKHLKIDTIDLIWMDLQGAELIALESAGALLERVRYIYTEVSHRPLYKGQCLFDEVDSFLLARGFRRCTKINRQRWQQDIIYENVRGLFDAAGALVPRHLPEIMDAVPEEFRLLLASARVRPSREDEAAIRRILAEGVDWERFARRVINHGLAGLCGRTLALVASDMVPANILDALSLVLEHARKGNQGLLDDLGRLIKSLEADGIEVIPFKGPVLAIQAFGDLGVREFRDLDFLVRDEDLTRAIAVLRRFGYERQGKFTDAQFAMIHRLQGQEIIFNRSDGIAVEPHTRLTPISLALDIDYSGIRRRAESLLFNGWSMLTLAPEDCVVILAIHGGKELWWNIKWACDIAAFIRSHPHLDWTVIEKRARSQGCLRMVLLATSLARKYFGASVSDAIIALELADPAIEPMAGRILAHWQADDLTGPPSNKTLSMDRLRLHDGMARKVSYIVRTLLLPKPHHIGFAALPEKLSAGYIPIKLVHDIVALPLYRAYQHIFAQSPQIEKPPTESTTASNILEAETLSSRALELLDANRVLEAIELNNQALALDQGNITAIRVDISSRMRICDWAKRGDDKRRIAKGLELGVRLIAPVFHRAINDSEAEHCAITRRKYSSDPYMPWRGELYRHDKIRIAYISNDFRDHVVSDVIVGCFEHHDKSRFETTAISLWPGDGSKMRRRIEAAFDRLIDVQAMNDVQVAEILRELEIDIAIDLNGYSGAKRTGILARRPVPVQVNYLGFPGTMNAPFIDYIVGDQVVIPEANQAFYREKVAYLPYTFFPADRTRSIAEKIPSRSEVGLPEHGFVFVCHNAPHKIGPEMYDIWMRLLRAVDGSVLWLRSANVAVIMNLRREASARGVAPERLVFAQTVPDAADHLARLQLADIFLDTLPYNAHATALDALWAGLPVLTCPGNSFPARVAASLLCAVGLPELVTTSLAEYEALALALANNPGRLAAIRTKLVRNRDAEALFDTARHTRYLEAAYTIMWQRHQAGLPPEAFIVAR